MGTLTHSDAFPCPNCGAMLVPEAQNYCHVCGRPLGGPDEPEVVKRRGRFAIAVSENNKWVHHTDLTKEKLDDVLETAKEHAMENGEQVIVYIANVEIEITP
jgi:hypothetical protein